MKQLGATLCFYLLTGCGHGPQSALNPGGDQALAVHDLLRVFVILLACIFAIVVAVALISLVRSHRGIEQEPLERTHEPSPESEHALWRAVGGASILTTLILLGLIVISVSTGKALSDRAMPHNALTIEVAASQWWWDVRYINDEAAQGFTTANEIHIPVVRPVMIRGMSLDVIHSFWVPGLQGKRGFHSLTRDDGVVYGGQTRAVSRTMRGICGLQHAHMALWVVAEDEAHFNAWRARQLEDSAAPSTPSEEQGQKVFLSKACVLCHTIRGTVAAGRNGPDLTHLASRISIAAGTLENNRGNLAGWIADPQTIKPGTHMATVPVSGDEMQALLDYLGSLR